MVVEVKVEVEIVANQRSGCLALLLAAAEVLPLRLECWLGH